MREWKQLLYDNYISSGQAGRNVYVEDGLHLTNYPYYKKLVANHLPQRFDLAIADLACGHGALIFCLKELGFVNVKGVDLSSEQVDLAHQLGLTDIKCQDMKGFLSENKKAFDVIFLMDILEHLTRVELIEILLLVKESLQRGGMVIIHVPNAEGFFGLRMRYGDLTHEISYTPTSIRQVLTYCGFQNVSCYEDKPVIHNVKSAFRYISWEILMFPIRLFLIAETGATDHILSQNMLVTVDVP